MKKRCEYCGKFYSGHRKQRFCSSTCSLASARDKKKNGSETVTTSVRIFKFQKMLLDKKLGISPSEALRFGINRLRVEDRTSLFFLELRPLLFSGTISIFLLFLGVIYAQLGHAEYMVLFSFAALITIIVVGSYVGIGLVIDFLKYRFIG